MTRLVAIDLGGTHARFAPATIGGAGAIALGEPVTLKTSDYASFQTAWEAYLAQVGGPHPDAVAIAIAGPVRGEVIRFTNNPWLIRPALIDEKLGVSAHTLINDFGAVGHAVARAEPSDFAHLCGPDRPLPGAGGYRVQSTEGGHIDFAPLDPIEDAILARLRQRYRRVSVERVVSGPGLADIYEVLAALEGKAVTARSDAELWQAGTGGDDSLAAAAVDRFCMSLGSVAGDIALAQGASGVVIAGGLGLRIKDTLLRSDFAGRFAAKGRFAGIMAEMPVKLITHPQPGLLGAAAAFATEHLP